MYNLNSIVLLLLGLFALHVAAFQVTVETVCLLIMTALVIQVRVMRSAPTWTLVVSSLLVSAAFTAFGTAETMTPVNLKLIEVASFSLIVVVAQKAGRSIQGFRDAVEELNIAISGGGAIPFEDWSSHVDDALANGRRFDQPLSVIEVQFPIPADSTALDRLLTNLSRGFKKRLVLQNIGGLLNESLRRTDVVLGDLDAGSLVVVCRSTSRDQADHVARSIVDNTREMTGLEVSCSTASFPADGLTFPDLLGCVRAGSGQQSPAGPPEISAVS